MLESHLFRTDIAEKYGVNGAIFLNNIVYWTLKNASENRHFYEERYWTYGSRKGYAKLYPFWSEDQIKRIITRLKEQGALLIGDFNTDRMNRTNWYSPSDMVLSMYGVEICPDGNVQKCPVHWAESPNSQGKIAQCLYNEIQNTKQRAIPPIPPKGETALFDRFWKAYPRKQGKQDARKAWDKLAPDLALCRIMAAALERQKRSAQWTKDGGAYIPYPATWLRGRRWEDETPPDGGHPGAVEEEKGVTYI